MVTYKAEVLDKLENAPGTWNSIRVGVFRHEGEKRGQIGEYFRNYPSLFRTFFHFRKNDKDFALYSRDYTASRIMELPSCKDIGGEDSHASGFCPVDFFVPRYIDREWVDWKDQIHRRRVNEPGADDLIATTSKFYPIDERTGARITVEKPDYPVTPLLYYPFGFVAGCVWGDDSSWKIEYLDLSNAENGILKRDARFGYIALPDSVPLEKAISFDGYNPDDSREWAHQVTISIQKQFDLRTGKEIDPLA